MMEKVLEVKNLKKYFPLKGGVLQKSKVQIRAVEDVSFDLYKGETLGLVGESGSGKSTTGRTILRLLEPTQGEITYEGKSISKMKRKDLRSFRKNAQMIFQDPYASLNPRMTVGEAIVEPILSHGLMSKKNAVETTMELLERVGLNPDYYHRFPHQFSGGQRQRIGIARALALNPKVIVADEPVSALDVSVQAQIINLFKDLQEEFGFTYLFIAHDLSVVKYLSTRIAVMYLGEIVEICDKEKLFERPLHPYTQALISAIPEPNPRKKEKRIILQGDIPSPSDPPKGCKFSNRCFKRMDICTKVHPEMIEVGGHGIRCHLYTEKEGN
ncbi:ABC transporter ATP-binding protein [Irregularibacter muris]|uniref:ABC transporter ATP-binding protein n=1 Tax=Irregularibacter muris TaxID=1796619 RepID=A0AAE3HI20_9FIRM|nr:ABC transporter ATP-binding protein [Irregularibacter muris]MCR1899329.1 ABC transporter ATP-binding protein [Irregularibacter muris]